MYRVQGCGWPAYNRSWSFLMDQRRNNSDTWELRQKNLRPNSVPGYAAVSMHIEEKQQTGDTRTTVHCKSAHMLFFSDGIKSFRLFEGFSCLFFKCACNFQPEEFVKSIDGL